MRKHVNIAITQIKVVIHGAKQEIIIIIIIPNNTTALARHGILLTYINFQSLRRVRLS